MQKSVYALYRGIWELLDWVFPPNCGGCGQPGVVWCPNCQKMTQPISGPICPTCGRPQTDKNPCSICSQTPPLYSGLRAYSYFTGPLRNAIHNLKYRRDLGLGQVFAGMLFDIKEFLDWQIDVVIPVPLSKARVRQRGYNQAAVVAYPFSLLSGIRYSSNLLFRTRDTRSQVGLSQEDRLLNMRNAFTADSSACMQKSILIIDDVTTTGSTIGACTKALFQAGANQVYCLTVARTHHADTDVIELPVRSESQS